MAIDDYLNQIARLSGQSPRDQRLSDSFYGLNILGRNPGIPVNTENHGFTFFTRPCLNLSYDNLIVDRVLSSLLVDEPNSVQRAIRLYLDPRQKDTGLSCPHVDERSPFIPLLSNNLISLSGFQDQILNTHASNPGLYREVYGYVDDVPYNYEQYDLTATFRNIMGDPISYLILVWARYQGLVYEGRIIPYPDFILYDEIDYMTRIYRLVMDTTRTYVTRIGATGASYPIVNPIGANFDFSGDGAETPFTTANNQISVQFRSYGFTYYDHILVYEFNTLVEMFNPSMSDDDAQRREQMVKLQHWERAYFSRQACPRINPLTMELEWWVAGDVYERQKKAATLDLSDPNNRQLTLPEGVS